MATCLNLHSNTPDASKHTPKGFDAAADMQYLIKDERSELLWTATLTLPQAINFVDGAVAPPTEVDGDIYVLDTNGGTIHADWDGALENDWVRYNATDDSWNALSPVGGYFCFDQTASAYKQHNGTDWAAFGAGGGNTIYTADDTLTGNRVVTMAGNTLNFSGGDVALNTNNFYLDASQNNVGFGTVTPNVAYRIDVIGKVRTSDDVQVVGAIGVGSSVESATNTVVRSEVLASNRGQTQWFDAGTENVRISSLNNGQIVVGNPGAVAAQNRFYSTSAGVGTQRVYIGSSAATGDAEFQAAGDVASAYLRIQNSGALPDVAHVTGSDTHSVGMVLSATGAGSQLKFGRINAGVYTQFGHFNNVGAFTLNDGGLAYTFPTVRATVAGQVLTDAAANGVLSWATPAGGSDGNGIYDGNGTIPAATTSTITDVWTVTGGDIKVGAGNAFYWDNSVSSLGLGTATPSAKLHITGATATNTRFESTSASSFVTSQFYAGGVFTGSITGYGASFAGTGSALYAGNFVVTTGSTTGQSLVLAGRAGDGTIDFVTGGQLASNLRARINSSGDLQVKVKLNLENVSTTTIGANGSASALTANPVGYATVKIDGTNYKIPYYNV